MTAKQKAPVTYGYVQFFLKIRFGDLTKDLATEIVFLATSQPLIGAKMTLT
jgi:hypothetical protein